MTLRQSVCLVVGVLVFLTYWPTVAEWLIDTLTAVGAG